jgi:hypothetical protein
LGGIIYDDLRPLSIQEFQQQIEFTGDMTGVIFEALFLFDAERESAPVQWIAADVDHLDRIGFLSQMIALLATP